jgi:cysteine-rich repeat protein
VLPGEQCDPDTGGTSNAKRAASSSSSCDSDCSAPRCGDGFVNVVADEDCDDTYLASGTPAVTPTCDTDCTDAACGDGVINAAFIIRLLHDDAMTIAGEACDPGTGTSPSDPQRALADTADCDRDCSPVRCGDAYISVLAEEECEHPYRISPNAPTPTASCDEDCTFPACGDGKRNAAAGEDCDDGNTTSGDTCPGNCQL